MSRKKFTEAEEAILVDDAADPIDRASAIDCMASDGLWLHEALVVSFFDHQDDELRSSAVRAAAKYDPQAYLPILIDQLVRDASESVRSRAAIMLEWVGMAKPALRPAVLLALVSAVDSDTSNDVCWNAYRSLVVVASGGSQHPPYVNDNFDRIRDVDADLLRPFRAIVARTSVS